jgi:tRNA (guanine-N7-)-methyltransferase
MIELKTDNDSFYKYSLESVHKSKIFKITYQTNNIYKDKSKIINNIQSEYEKKFIKLNKNINKIELSN